MSIPSLEDRLRAIEDRLAIYTLIASHPPSADTAAANYTREVYEGRIAHVTGYYDSVKMTALFRD